METLSHLRLSKEDTRPFKSTNMLLSSLGKELLRFVSKYSKNDSASDLSKKIISKLSSLPQSSQIVQILQRPLANHGYPEVVIVMIMKMTMTNICTYKQKKLNLLCERLSTLRLSRLANTSPLIVLHLFSDSLKGRKSQNHYKFGKLFSCRISFKSPHLSP